MWHSPEVTLILRVHCIWYLPGYDLYIQCDQCGIYLAVTLIVRGSLLLPYIVGGASTVTSNRGNTENICNTMYGSYIKQTGNFTPSLFFIISHLLSKKINEQSHIIKISLLLLHVLSIQLYIMCSCISNQWILLHIMYIYNTYCALPEINIEDFCKWNSYEEQHWLCSTKSFFTTITVHSPNLSTVMVTSAFTIYKRNQHLIRPNEYVKRQNSFIFQWLSN